MEGCVLREGEFARQSLAGLDFSTCEISGIRVSPADIRGAKISPAQAMEICGIFGVEIV